MNNTTRRKVGLIGKGIAVAIVLGYTLLPVYILFVESFKPERFWLTGNLIPQVFSFSNYIDTLFGHTFIQVTYVSPIAPAFLNSVIVAGSDTLISALVGSLAAYGFQRYNIGGGFLASWMLTVLFIPTIGVIIPLLVFYTHINLYNSLLSVILTNLTIGIPLTIWMMISVYQSIPRSLEEAAYVDGYGKLKTFFKFVLPVSFFGLLGTAVLVFIFSWNALTAALVLESSQANYTLPLYIGSFKSLYGTVYGVEAATSILMSIPTLVFVVFVVKYLGKGLVSGFGKR